MIAQDQQAHAEITSDFWHTAVVYQIYPRSFADSNGDGVGDLPGITSRIPYLRSLGVDAVWLTPFYPSALADGGYDVDDHRDVDPRLGTLADFDAMVAALHAAGIKVIVDIVPNHTSNRHPWFVQALAAGPGSPERDRYLFRDGRGVHGEEPPNDWESLFGGSAWAPAGEGQWYLHCFAAEQPDLNWENGDVREDFQSTLRFWADRGVDGFRIDVAHGLRKDMSEPYPPWAEIADIMRPDGSHPLWDRDDVHEIYADWRRVFNAYDPPRVAVAEAIVHPTRRARYASADSLGQAFNFAMQDADWRPEDYRQVINAGLADMINTGSTTSWLLGCHDTPRVASRYGLPLADGSTAQQVARAWLLRDGTSPRLDWTRGERRARAAIMILLALPGSTYLYQGDELGLHEVADLPQDALEDPMASRSTSEKGRDGCRVPLPWTPQEPSYGFGPGGAHLPQPDWFDRYAVSVQDADPNSTLNLYRQALGLRGHLFVGNGSRAAVLRKSEGTRFLSPSDDEVGGYPARSARSECQRAEQSNNGFSWVESEPPVLHFARPGGVRCITNFGAEPIALPAGEVLLSSAHLDHGRLPADSTAWMRVS